MSENENVYYTQLLYDSSLEKRRVVYIIFLILIIFGLIIGYAIFYILYTGNSFFGIINPVGEVYTDTSIGELYNIGQYFLFTGYQEDGVTPIDSGIKDRNYNNPINGTKLTKDNCTLKNMIYENNHCKCITPYWGEYCEKQSFSNNYFQLGKYFGSIDELFTRTTNIGTYNTITWCSNFSLQNSTCDPNFTVEYLCKNDPLCIGYFYEQGNASFLKSLTADDYLFSLNIDKIDNTQDDRGNYIKNGNIFVKNDFARFFSSENVYKFPNIIYSTLERYWIFDISYNSYVIDPNLYSYSIKTNSYITITPNDILLNGKYFNYYLIYFNDSSYAMKFSNDWLNFCKNISDGKYFFKRRVIQPQKLTYVYFVKVEDMIKFCNFSI